MADDLRDQADLLLGQGKSRAEVFGRLKGVDEAQLAAYLNSIALPERKRTFLYLNIILAGVLSFMTGQKIIAAMSEINSGLLLALAFVVPCINIYVLRQVLCFRRVGYQYLFVLSLLALLQPENRRLPESALLLTLVVLSGFLHQKLFPRKDMLPHPVPQTTGR